MEGLVVVTGLDTLATALYVSCDDLMKSHPERVPVKCPAFHE